MAVGNGQLKEWRKGLRSTIPILGKMRRRRVIEALHAHRNEPEVAPLLAEALALSDPEVSTRAEAALADLAAQPAIDALCAVWAKNRDSRLGQLIAQRGYVASRPPELQVLSGLQAGAVSVLCQAGGDLIAPLVAVLDDGEPRFRQNALAVLEGLAAQPAIDTLCAAWAKNRDSRLGQLIAQRGYVASRPPESRVLSGLRAAAIEVLSQGGGDLIAPLVAAMDDAEPVIRQNALAVLERLTAQPAIDALGALWAKNRDARLGQILTQRAYIAGKPLPVMVLTALKCGRRVRLDRTDAVPLMLGLTADPDETVRTGAVACLENVCEGPALEALCDEAMKNPTGPAAQICLRKGLRPGDHERRCLFLFVTRQLDAYFKEDFEFQGLRPQYDRADAAVKAHVMEVVRSGDRRCAAFFATKSKPVAECTEAEIKLAMEAWLRHQDWGSLFHACLELPLKYSYPALVRLRQSKWEPEAADLKSVCRQVLADVDDQALPPPKKPSAESPLFEQWLARGHNGELARLDEAALCGRLRDASPPDGVAIVGALACRKSLSKSSLDSVRSSPHWLVRLAGHATGISSSPLMRDTVNDANYWITELASATGLLDFLPGKATPADLEKLSAAPPEAWTGKLGSARKVLRTIMTHRITTGSFERMIVEVREDAGVFVQATEVKRDTGNRPKRK